ncbi:hypothetical protein DL770_004852 [Monosporascus sp. CRB-9-2]|nr:hypothetical protein DL770_004852 [Monosporascus sp. CRB-9-2]
MEAIGLAASGIALVDVTAQLAHTCLKLYDFWESIRDAPRDVQDILVDLRIMQNILREISTEKELASSVSLILSSCVTKTQELEAIMHDFDAGLMPLKSKKERLWTALKFTGKAKQFQKFRESLSHTKQTLSLALIHQNVQRPQIVLYNQDIDSVSVPVVGSKSGDPYRPSLFEPAFKMPTAKNDSVPDVAPPAYSPRESPYEQRTATPSSTGVVRRDEKNTLAAVVSSKPVQSFLQHSLHMAVDNMFASGMVQQLMDATLNQVTSFETGASGTYTADGYTIERGFPTFKDSKHDAPEEAQDHRRGRPRLARSHTCHKTSSMGIMLGSVWIRHSTLKVEDGSDPSGGRLEVVTSLIFYPSTWLTKFGLGYGTEASLTCSPTGGWKFNLTPLRAVPENSLIFDLCRRGEVQAVKLMLERGDASVKDTSPKGWSPLHFAAAEGRIELCEALINAGADKNALAYEGPTENALSPITIFAETCQSLPAHQKISMLRLFADTLDLSDPNGDGWTVITSLVKALNKESVPMTEISANWLLRLTSSEQIVAFGAKTIWDGLQHAVRSFLFHEQNSNVLRELLGLKADAENSQGSGAMGMEAQATALSHWLALRASQRDLLPMVVEAGRFSKMDGFDWVEDGITPRDRCRALPAIYAAWTKALPNGIEQFKDVMERELVTLLESLGIDREMLQSAIQEGELEHSFGDQQVCGENEQVCGDCRNSYVRLGTGLVRPRLIEFEECCKTHHKRDCRCRAFLEGCQLQNSPHHATVPEGSDDESDVDEEFIAENDDVLDQLCDRYDKSQQQQEGGDPFRDSATLLYRAQGRRWLGTYESGDVLCATCFLRRERYLGSGGKWTDYNFTPMPESYGVYVSDFKIASTM